MVASISAALTPAFILLVNQADKTLAPYGDKLQALNLVAMGAKKALADYKNELPPSLYAILEAAAQQVELFTNGIEDNAGSSTPN